MLKLWQSTDFSVRTSTNNHDVLFCVKDICEAIGIKNSRDKVKILRPRELFVSEFSTRKGPRQFNMLASYHGIPTLHVAKSTTPFSTVVGFCYVLREHGTMYSVSLLVVLMARNLPSKLLHFFQLVFAQLSSYHYYLSHFTA